MPDLSFQIEGFKAVPHAAAPLIVARLRIENADAQQPIQNIALRAQVQIETTRRRYTTDEQSQLGDLFGEPERWSRTLRSLLWLHTSVIVLPFEGSTTVDLPLPCTFDFNVAAAKYFHALAEGEVSLSFLFSGTMFFAADEGNLQVAQIPWDKEARGRLPVSVWKEMIDLYYPNSAWLRLRRDVFDRLYRYKRERGIPTWEAAIESLLTAREVQVPS